MTLKNERFWMDDRSQSFMVRQANLEDVYLNVLGMSKKRELKDGTDAVIEFVMYLSSDKHIYTFDFAIAKSDYALQRVSMKRSLLLDFNPAAMRIATFPAHHLANNPTWPDFWIFATTTKFKTQTEARLAGEEWRVKDGLLISEFFFRKIDKLELMTTTTDIKDKFSAVGPPVEGIIYSDSRVIPVENA